MAVEGVETVEGGGLAVGRRRSTYACTRGRERSKGGQGKLKGKRNKEVRQPRAVRVRTQEHAGGGGVQQQTEPGCMYVLLLATRTVLAHAPHADSGGGKAIL